MLHRLPIKPGIGIIYLHSKQRFPHENRTKLFPFPSNLRVQTELYETPWCIDAGKRKEPRIWRAYRLPHLRAVLTLETKHSGSISKSMLKLLLKITK